MDEPVIGAQCVRTCRLGHEIPRFGNRLTINGRLYGLGNGSRELSCQKGKLIPIIQLVMILNVAFRGSQDSYLPNQCEFKITVIIFRETKLVLW